MNKKKLQVGIAGYGVVGTRRRHYIDMHPQLETVAVCDQKYPEAFVLPDGIKAFSNYQQLLNEKLDILFVSLPNYLAAEVTIEGLKRGIHVFCEKPPGRNVADIKRVIEEEQRRPNLKLKYGFNHRYHDSVRKALEIIRSKELGGVINLRGVYGKSKIIPFSGGWRAERKYSGGGILLDQGIHMVDLMRLFCDEFVEVKSFVSNAFWKHDVEDNAYALMRDKNGRIAMLHSTATQWQHRFALDIALTHGFIELRGILSGSKSYGSEKLIIGRRNEADVGSTGEEIITFLTDNSWRDEVNEFADAVINDSKVTEGSSAEALATMQLVYQIYHSDPEWKAAYHKEEGI
ncbi:MAG: Gfo/Idh/MocA family oxidoreductase [bacterium]